MASELLSDWPADRWVDRKLVVGVSGGADSVALLLALHELAACDQLVVAHLNHNWRGQESRDDEAFVVELCQSLQRPCLTALLRDRDSEQASHCDGDSCRDSAMLAKDSGGVSLSAEDVSAGDSVKQKTEERARRARYEFFKECAYQVGASYVVTAHTANDRVETLLHNLFRGSGLAGAASLVMTRPFDQDLVLVRPLLKKQRADIEAFLESRGQAYRVDSSNYQTHYRRNFLRRQVLPLLSEHYPAASDNLLHFSEIAEELSADLNQLADRWQDELAQALSQPGESLSLARQRWPAADYFVAPIAAMLSTPWSIIQLALRKEWQVRNWPLVDMSRTHWLALRDLCKQNGAVVNLPGALRAENRLGFLAVGRAGRPDKKMV